MRRIVELDQPRAKIVDGGRGYVAVYGWRKEFVTDRGAVPLSGLVSLHVFRWTARRAMRRWLKGQGGR